MIRDYTWSPKRAYLAFSMNDPSGTRSLHIWSVADAQVHRVTDETFNEEAPSWDPEGKYLYYQSERQFAPQISQVEWNFAGARMTGLFALTLRKDGKSPFPPPSDEVTFGEKKDEAKPEAGTSEKKEEKAEAKNKAKAEPEKKETPFRIDFDGLASRVTPVPVDADNYQGVVAVKGHLLYVKADAPFYGRDPRTKASLVIYSIKDRKESTLADGVDAWAVSRDGSKVLVRIEDALQLLDAKPDAKPDAKEKKTVSTKGLMVDRVPTQEWAEIFDEVWRRYRDFFYVANMHGYDWKAIGERYRALLPVRRPTAPTSTTSSARWSRS